MGRWEAVEEAERARDGSADKHARGEGDQEHARKETATNRGTKLNSCQHFPSADHTGAIKRRPCRQPLKLAAKVWLLPRIRGQIPSREAGAELKQECQTKHAAAASSTANNSASTTVSAPSCGPREPGWAAGTP